MQAAPTPAVVEDSGGPVEEPPKRLARAVLRDATQAQHERVDSLPLMRRLLHPRVTRTDYGKALERLGAVHLALCAAISNGIGDCAHPRLRVDDLLPAVQSDLASLRFRLSPAVVAAPRFNSASEALGAWYVLEGASLGGKVIARHLREQLGTDLPLSHFDGRARQRWPEFLRHLEDQLPTDEARAAAVRGARGAYDFVARTLES